MNQCREIFERFEALGQNDERWPYLEVGFTANHSDGLIVTLLEIEGGKTGVTCGVHFEPLCKAHAPALLTWNRNTGRLLRASWFQQGILHNDIGPAMIWDIIDKDEYSARFYIRDRRIGASEIDRWIVENGLPSWTEWTDVERLMFKMRFE